MSLFYIIPGIKMPVVNVNLLVDEKTYAAVQAGVLELCGMAKNIASSIGASMPTSTLKMAIAVLGAVPVLVIFPFVSRYLTGGIVVGAVKG